jgi:formate hydrogenlyase transcriptional activator
VRAFSYVGLYYAIQEMAYEETAFRQMIDEIPTLAWSCLPDGTGDFLNRRWLEYTGLSREAAQDWRWKAVVHPDDLNNFMDTWRRHRAAGEPVEVEARLRRLDGIYRWFLFRAVPVRDAKNNVIKWYGTNTDIEDRKQMEERLRRDKVELRLIIDTIPQYIIVLEPDGKLMQVNQQVLEYNGLTLNDVQATDFRSRFLHPEDWARLAGERRERLARGDPFELEMRSLGKDGRYRWFLMKYNPQRDEQGRVIRWYATGTDIEERKQAEERMRNEVVALREEIDRSSMFDEIVGSSESLCQVLVQVAKVASSDSTVLILGETGTGKELIARAIHRRSKRSRGAFIRVNCAAISQSLIASELFGHEKGAFTGAVERRIGHFESADGGTIFLDEIGELPIETQVALLRVLQEGEIERVGSSHTISLDVRVLAATNRDLKAAVTKGTFRQDLFYRLNVVPIYMPPLRERREDIPLLAEYFIERYAKKAGRKFRGIQKRTLELFGAYDWSGNIRELQNVIERAVVLSESETFSVDPRWLDREPPSPAAALVPLATTRSEHEKEAIEAALAKSRGRVSGPAGAANMLGIPRQTLESRIKILGIDKDRFRILG